MKATVFTVKSKSKSTNFAPILDFAKLLFGILTFPSSPLTVPTGLGKFLILYVVEVETFLPSGSVPVANILTVLPVPGFITYFDPLALLSPGADALTLLSAIPGIEIVIGFSTPL